MPVNEVGNRRTLVAPELVDVRWPWNLNRREEGDSVAYPSGTDEDFRVALISFDALLRFMREHQGDVQGARETVPELVDAYWFIWEDDLIETMPTMQDLTWAGFDGWADRVAPSEVDSTWRKKPEDFVASAAWLWTNGSVQISANRLIRWFVGQSKRVGSSPPVSEFLEMATSYAPHTSDFCGVLIGAISRVGGSSSISYLDRLATEDSLADEFREEARRLYRWRKDVR